MALLKEDGSLDMEQYFNLPLHDWMDAMFDLTEEQVDEYLSKLPIDEDTNAPMTPLEVGPDFDTGVDADEVINNLKKFCDERK